MLILRDFKCNLCGSIFEDLTEGCSTQCSCGSEAFLFITKVSVAGIDSFNPHYDEQIGQWFESAEHKKSVLKDLGVRQTRGPLSPRQTKKTSMKMTKSQSLKFDPWQSDRLLEAKEDFTKEHK